jgi:serine/threonine protein kinase
MFLNEARLAAQLNHSNVVHVFEAGEIDGRYYISMEYIEGADLRMFYEEAEQTHAPLAPGLACRIIADLLAGLHYAHTLTDSQGRPLGIVHRDVSPQNVLVTRSGSVKIVDFGIAKATRIAQQQTQAGRVKGKVAYLSPEQAMGRPLDARSDVFACGILLWELVTGTRLFVRSNDMATIMAITEDDVAPPSSIRRELPEALDRILAQALNRTLVDRYPSAKAMQTDLEAIIRSQSWPGDRRALERHMQARLESTTPAFGATAFPTTPAVQPETSGIHPVLGDDYNDGPTVLGTPMDVMAMVASSQSMLTNRAPQSIESAETMVAMDGDDYSGEITDQHKRMPVHLNIPPDVPPPSPIVERPRTPSGMRAMPSAAPITVISQAVSAPVAAPLSTPGPANPPMVYGNAAHQTQPFDSPTESKPMGGTFRRILVIATAALVVSVATIFALDWRTHHKGQGTAATGPALLVVDVSEPTWVEIEGVRTRIDGKGELDLPLGKQITVSAVPVRTTGSPATRTIALPPAHAGERIPLKMTFPTR